ncbi:MAG: DNA methylase, partial [Rikenellaceae bacterium]
HNKQMFIEQLKNNSMGSRTIDEGSLDEKSGMNFSEYVAILSGNTDLLEKAKIEKKITALESERQAFTRSKSQSKAKLDNIQYIISGNDSMIARISSDMALLDSRMQYDKDGGKLNPITLFGVEGSDPKKIGAKLAEINERARTKGAELDIGTLYGFRVVVRTESSDKDLFDMTHNKFMVISENGIKYSYNNGNIAADPLLAATNFLSALDKMSSLLERYQKDNEIQRADIPILQEVLSSTWRKEDELKELKGELATLDRKIQLSLKPIEQGDEDALKVPQREPQPDEVTSKSETIVATSPSAMLEQRITLMSPNSQEVAESIKPPESARVNRPSKGFGL